MQNKDKFGILQSRELVKHEKIVDFVQSPCPERKSARGKRKENPK